MPDYAKYEFLAIEVAHRIATVTINRPQRRNALNRPLIDALHLVWVDLARDPAVDVVLLTAAGEYFSVGGDVKAMSERPGGDFLEQDEFPDPALGRRMAYNMLAMDKPVVCAINGDAIGLGATAALFCDVTVMNEQARIGDPHVKVGLVAGDGGTVIWPLLVGVSRAKEFLMLGSLVRGTDAARLGLVNHAVPADQVLPKAREIATALAEGATWAIRFTKACINKQLMQQVNLVLDTSIALEHVTMHTRDHAEATRAFAEKRKPVFQGR
jgi:enoyl-CoA hydratase/carnithine racemase